MRWRKQENKREEWVRWMFTDGKQVHAEVSLNYAAHKVGYPYIVVWNIRDYKELGLPEEFVGIKKTYSKDEAYEIVKNRKKMLADYIRQFEGLFVEG